MLKGIRKFFAPPEVEDAMLTQAAATLHIIQLLFTGAALAGVIFGIVTALFGLQGSRPDRFMFGTAAGGLIVSLFLRWLMHRGYIRLVGALTTIPLFLLVGLTSFQYGGLNGITASGFVLVIIVAGLLLGMGGALLFTGFSILGTFALQYLQSTGFIGQNIATTPLVSDWFTYLLVLLLGGILIGISSRNINAANRKTQEVLLTVNKTQAALLETEMSLKENRQILAEQSAELDQYFHYQEISASITKTAATSRDAQQFMEKIVMLISEKFNHYHTGIFLTDEANEWAVLTAASSPGGHQLIAQGYRVQAGKQGIIGFVIGLGQAHIAQDTANDSLYVHVPELPATRSEMTLPLKVRGEVIGALDIQDVQADSFAENMIAVFQALADQIALSVNNLRLQQQTQQNIAEMQKLYGEISQAVWVERHGVSGAYRFSRGQVQTLKNVPETEVSEDETSQKNVIKLPIRVRDNVVGYIDIVRQTEDAEFSPEEKDLMETLSDQLGVAMESASLFQESQRLAADERMVSDISAHIRETLDINTILQTAAAEIRQATGLPEVTIRLATDLAGTFRDGNGHK